MRRITEIPMARLQALPQHFSAATAERVHGVTVAEGLGVWRCDLNMTGESWSAVYVGPSPDECWSFLVWRNIELLGKAYREAVGQLTEKKHERKGLGRAVLEAALQGDSPLLSDREGMTYNAMRLWRLRALKGGAAVLDTLTGSNAEVASLTENELWHYEENCERHQLVFWPVSGGCDPAISRFSQSA